MSQVLLDAQAYTKKTTSLTKCNMNMALKKIVNSSTIYIYIDTIYHSNWQFIGQNFLCAFIQESYHFKW